MYLKAVVVEYSFCLVRYSTCLVTSQYLVSHHFLIWSLWTLPFCHCRPNLWFWSRFWMQKYIKTNRIRDIRSKSFYKCIVSCRTNHRRLIMKMVKESPLRNIIYQTTKWAEKDCKKTAQSLQIERSSARVNQTGWSFSSKPRIWPSIFTEYSPWWIIRRKLIDGLKWWKMDVIKFRIWKFWKAHRNQRIQFHKLMNYSDSIFSDIFFSFHPKRNFSDIFTHFKNL